MSQSVLSLNRMLYKEGDEFICGYKGSFNFNNASSTSLQHFLPGLVRPCTVMCFGGKGCQRRGFHFLVSTKAFPLALILKRKISYNGTNTNPKTPGLFLELLLGTVWVVLFVFGSEHTASISGVDKVHKPCTWVKVEIPRVKYSSSVSRSSSL